MSATAAPYGLRPVKRADGLPYSGAVSHYLIDPAGLASNIYNGSVVYLNSSGYVAVVTATGADGTTNAFPAGTTLTGAIGVFVGCSYVNTQGQQIYAQYYPSGTTGVVTAYVVDDPNVVFQGQADGAVAQAKLGENTTFAAVQSTSTGSTLNGNSNTALESTTATTTMPFRIIGFASTPGDAFTDIYVKFNPGWHSLTQVVGL